MGNTVKDSKEWWENVLARANIPYCDGRAVFKYELDKTDISEARSILLRNANAVKENLASARLYGLFICYASEVFKRNVVSTKRTWAPILDEIGFENDPNKLGKWCEAGLRFLGCKPRTTAQGRQWLQTIQLLGGFPLQAIVSSEGGWVKQFLSSIFKSALKYTTPIDDQIAENIVIQNLDWVSNSAFREDYDFRILSRELVKSMQSLWCIHRDDLPEGFSFHQWLSHKEPNWKRFLPIRVPEEDEEKLFSLLAAEIDEAVKTYGEIVANKVVRGVAYQNGVYVPTLSIDFADKFKPKGLSENSRLRLSASGELANFVRGELAISNPPVSEGDKWKIRSKGIENLKGFPLTAIVSAKWTDSKGSEVSCDFVGHNLPVVGDIHVFASNDERNLSGRYVGSGSVSTRYEKLILIAPQNCVFEAVNDTEINDAIFEKLGETKDGLEVYFTNQSVIITIIGNDEKYRVTPNSIEKNYDIYPALIGTKNWQPIDQNIEIGSMPIRILENGITRQIKSGELFWRKDRSSEWNDYTSKAPTFGRVRFKWLDRETGHILLSKSMFLLSAVSVIRGKLEGKKVTISEIPSGSKFSLSDERVSNQNDLIGYFNTTPSTIISCILNVGGDDLEINLNLRIGKNCFIDKAGNLLNDELRIDGLKGAIANSKIDNNAIILRVKSTGDADGQTAFVRFPKGRQQFPLYELESVIWQLIAIEIDPDVKIEISWMDGEGKKLVIKPFDPQIPIYNGSVLRNTMPNNSRLYFRPLTRPWEEIEALEMKGLSFEGQEFFELPEKLTPPALMYSRIDEFVNTRPRLYLGVNHIHENELERICLIKDKDLRLKEYRKWFEDSPIDKSSKIVAQIAKSLNGFPVTCLDIMTCIPDNVLVAALLRHPNEREAIFNLQKELPFHWITIRQTIWINEIVNWGTILTNTLWPINGSKAPIEAFDQISKILENIIEYDSSLAYVVIKYLKNKDKYLNSHILKMERYLGDMQDAIFSSSMPSFYYPRMSLHQNLINSIPKEFMGIMGFNDKKNWFITPIVAAHSTIGRINPTLRERLGFFIARKEFPEEFENVFAKIVLKEGLNV